LLKSLNLGGLVEEKQKKEKMKNEVVDQEYESMRNLSMEEMRRTFG